MNDHHGLTFFLAGPAVVLGAVLVLVTAGLCFTAWRRSGYRPATGALELLRFFLVVLVVATLGQPEWLEAEVPEQRSVLAVLWDESNSMLTRDVVDASGTSAEPISRAAAIEPLLSEAAWTSTGPEATNAVHVVFEPFSSKLEAAKDGTDLHAGLASVLDGHANLRGVVLLSDGDWNTGRSPADAATRYRVQGIPVFTVGVGSKDPLPDLELVRMDAPTFGVVRKALRIPFVVRSTLGQEREVHVDLRVDGQPAVTKVIRVPAMDEVQRDLTWTPPVTGDFTLRMQVARDGQEVLVENNRIEAPIAVREEQLNVLVLESYPRWEYRYLRNALERDPGVEVSCLLFHPELPKHGGGRSYIEQFPAPGALSRFDVVFLGDVGIGPKQLTVDQARDIRQLVSAQAAGLVFLPGRYGFQETLAASPLADLLPVVLDAARPAGIGSAAPGHFTLTQAGQQSLLTRLSASDEANADIWRRLPGFNWHAAATRAKAGAEVLAVHESESTEFGRVPLIVTKPYGTGKVLFMGSDSAWRWREGVEDRYHYRFWGQVARWMAYQRQMAVGQSMRLFFTPDRPQVDDVVALNVNALDSSGGPLTEGTVVVQAISPSGKTAAIRLQPGAKDAWGLFVGSYVPKEPGAYRLVVTCAETAAAIETDLSVQGLHRERTGRLARFDVLEEIAAIAQGRFVPVSGAGSLQAHLATLPEPDRLIHRTPIWCHPAWCGVLIALLSVFWVGRKMVGAV